MLIKLSVTWKVTLKTTLVARSDQLHAPASFILPRKTITGVSTMLHEPAELRLATFRSSKHVQWSDKLNPKIFHF